MIKFSIKIFLFITLVCCGNKKSGKIRESSSIEIEKKVMKLRYNYFTSGNKSFLDSAYVLINRSEYFENNQLNDENLELFYPIYYDLEKFMEISLLLNKSNNLSQFKKKYCLNLSNAFLNYKKGNLGLAKNEIKRNINLLKNKMELNPLDSIIVIDFFKMKLHLKDYNSVIKEVDSLKQNGKMFSEIFYNDILIPELNDYKRELPNYVIQIPPKLDTSSN